MKRLLIVDDEPSILLGMKRYFCARGYDVDCAGEPEEAIALLVNVAYACVITDLCLSEGHGPDGLQVVAYVGARLPQTPVVVLTGYAAPCSERAARRLGASAFLPKPQTMAHLAEVVGALMGSSS